MQKFAFVSRHSPTASQAHLAAIAGIELIPIGDRDGFAVRREDLPADVAGAVVVHAAAALRLVSRFFQVGVYNNVNRAPVGSPPTFEATEFHLYTLSDGDSTSEVEVETYPKPKEAP